MLGPPPGTRVFLAYGVKDMRKGFDGRAALVQTVLAQDPYSGAMFCFLGRRGDLLKVLVWHGQGLVRVAKRLEKGRFVWPLAQSGAVTLTAAQLSRRVEGIDWRMHIAHGNTTRARVHSRVEHVFGAEKRGMRLVIRCVGLARATVRITVANLGYNMRRLVWIEGRGVHA